MDFEGPFVFAFRLFVVVVVVVVVVVNAFWSVLFGSDLWFSH